MTHKCFFNCGASFKTKFTAPSNYEGWHWFTGYAKETMYFCPQCRKKRAQDIQKIKRQSEMQPEDYPRKYAPIEFDGIT